MGAAALGVTSCGTTSPQARQAGRRFHEGEAVDVVFRFYSWNTIFVTRPMFREQGFLTIFNRNNLVRVLERRDIGRGMAAVIVGHTYSTAQECDMIRDWNAILGERGFERVVFLRSGRQNKINGLTVVYDSAASTAYDLRGESAITVASVPPASGASMADSAASPSGQIPPRLASRSGS